MPDVHVIDPFVRETWWNSLVFLFHFQRQRQEPLDVGRGDIVSVAPLDERFALDIENGDCRLVLIVVVTYLDWP